MLDNNLILLAEDDENDVALIQRAFRKAGLRETLAVVQDGDEAIEYLAERGVYSDRQRFPMPFLLLLDLKMPATDGFEVLQWARAQSELKRLLIVVLTSSNLQEDVDRAYELGANSYMVKPLGFKEMVNLVQRFEAYWSELNRIPSGAEALKLARHESTLL
jgi:CheY-like chemotaxis protein